MDVQSLRLPPGAAGSGRPIARQREEDVTDRPIAYRRTQKPFRCRLEEACRRHTPTLLKVVEESRAEVATLAATVAEMRDTIKSLTAENGGLRNELQTAREAVSPLTRAPTTPPPPPATPTPTPPARAPPKRKRTESQSPRQPTKQARDTSPTPTLMHSKHAGPSVTTGPTQPPPTTEPPRVDSFETEEGWKKVERKRWKGKREKKVGPVGGVPTWADIARGGGVRVNVFIGGGVGYAEPKARRPAGKRKKQRGQQRPASSSIAG